MAEFVAFSDHHAHNFRFNAKKVPLCTGGYYNSRLLESAKVLREIHAYCMEHRVFTVLFGGDLFHKRTVVHTDVWNITFQELRRFKDSGIQLIMIPGNHDYADRQGYIHSLDSLREVATIMDTVEATETAGGKLAVVSVPYTDSKETAKERLKRAAELGHQQSVPTILLGHLGVQGAKVGSDYVLVSDGDVKVSDITSSAFDLCLFGHFHQHQKLFPNGYFIGASHQHNWGDANTKRGFLHFTMEEGKKPTFDFIESSAPRFLKLSGDDSTDHVRPVDFVKWKGKDGQEMPAVLDSLTPFAEDVTPQVEVDTHIAEEDLDASAAIEVWAKLHNEEPEELIKLGKALLAQAEEALL